MLTPDGAHSADGAFQLSQTGLLTVRNSALLDRERTPSLQLQVVKRSLLLSTAARGNG